MSEKLMFPKFQEYLAKHPFKQALIAGLISGIAVAVINNPSKADLT